MEDLVNESQLPPTTRDTLHKEANQILDMIEDFGQQIASHTPAQLSKDLVTIRRRSNRLALDIYLSTFDMRWPQNSLQLGVIVERVQQACLDRAAIQLLEAPLSPLPELLGMSEERSNEAVPSTATVDDSTTAKNKKSVAQSAPL